MKAWQLRGCSDLILIDLVNTLYAETRTVTSLALAGSTSSINNNDSLSPVKNSMISEAFPRHHREVVIHYKPTA